MPRLPRYNPRPQGQACQDLSLVLMSKTPESALREAVESYVDPYLGLELRAAGALRGFELDGERLAISLTLGFPARHYRDELAAAIEQRLRPLAGARRVTIDVDWQIAAHGAQRNLRPIQGIRNIIAVASGKGGVGKSTTAANLALGLAHEGAAVGLLDADIYGPSQPLMMGLAGQSPTSPDQRTMIAPVAYDVKVMSVGFLIDAEQPMVWRGPMVTQALVQLLETTRWGELDYLIVDMPPGTGDTQLTLTQRVPVSGAVIVTTPQEVASGDALRGAKMFQRVAVPVLGVVENMSYFICPHCENKHRIFGEGGGRSLADELHVPLLAEVPFFPAVLSGGDRGEPIVIGEPTTPAAQALSDLAGKLRGLLPPARREAARQ